MIRVLKPGLFTTVQDEGRQGYRAFGVPPAGAMDRYAYRVANLLAGNEAGEAAIEMTMAGADFAFEAEAIVAVSGADMGARLNNRPVRNWSSFAVAAGSELSFSFARHGCRSYLAVAGGWDVPSVLGSRSTYLRARLGGLGGRLLKAGDVLQSRAGSRGAGRTACVPHRFVPEYARETVLRVLLGPQDDFFSAGGIEAFLTGLYTVANRNDRMGYVLEGPGIAHRAGADIVSDALCPGSIQVPGDGMPIVMMADCQTTGGYAKIATVIGSDLVLLAQCKAGDCVRFAACTEGEAVRALSDERCRYRELKGLLRF